jgi:hypothetical protein
MWGRGREVAFLSANPPAKTTSGGQRQATPHYFKARGGIRIGGQFDVEQSALCASVSPRMSGGDSGLCATMPMGPIIKEHSNQVNADLQQSF